MNPHHAPSSPSHSPRQGLFISFEGIDGAGKSTHIQALAQAFEAQGRRVTLTREVGGTALAEQLREMLLHQDMDALTEALLVFAARRDHIRQVIAPALAQGQVVISDRFADASFAYQGAGRGLAWEDLLVIERMCLRLEQGADLLQPHITLWFDLDPAIAAQRLASARLP
ncbi:MAG: dTMP kinase, partial [Comamonas sp.]|nr:dTMP kinase [Comamonas sp.]